MESDADYADRMLEVHVLGQFDAMRIYPQLDAAGDDVPIDRALSEPDEVYRQLRDHPYEDGRLFLAYYGWPEVLFFVGEAVVAGVTGNAAYDALKTVLVAIRERQSRDVRQQQLSGEEATRLARALLRSWNCSEGRMRTLDVSLFESGKWIVVIKSSDVIYHVSIPPGPVERVRIRVVRQDGSSRWSRTVGGLKRLAMRLRYRL